MTLLKPFSSELQITEMESQKNPDESVEAGKKGDEEKPGPSGVRMRKAEKKSEAADKQNPVKRVTYFLILH